MKTILPKVFLSALIVFSGIFGMNAQKDIIDNDKEVIIIDRTIDEEGNVISKIITRKKGSQMTDEELDQLLENGIVPGDFGDFGSENFGKLFKWGPDKWGGQDTRPTIGVSLTFEGDKAVVSDIMKGSGAEEEDIRLGDHLVSINRVPISVFDDVQQALNGRKIGEKVDLVVVRDGQEIEKRIELRANRFGEMGFTFPGDWGKNGFSFDLDDADGIKIFTDSLLKDFDWNKMIPDMRSFDRGGNADRMQEDSNEKPQLGIFIEDTINGVLITEVMADTPAARAGLKKGDVIHRINDEVVTSYRELVMVLDRKVKGDKVNLSIERDQSRKEIDVELN